MGMCGHQPSSPRHSTCEGLAQVKQLRNQRVKFAPGGGKLGALISLCLNVDICSLDGVQFEYGLSRLRSSMLVYEN